MTIAEDLLKKSLRSKIVILVAEREAVSFSSLSDLLRDEGYQVLEASDSVSAISYIDNHRALRVILADLGMPGWNLIIRHAQTVLWHPSSCVWLPRYSLPMLQRLKGSAPVRTF